MIGGRRSRIFAYGIRNSFGFTFDPESRRLWETENGPSCNDEINLVRRGGNYAWGPNESCPNTNQDGPAPRRLPKVNFPTTIGITGAVFCDGCGLAGREGDLLFGDCCGSGAVQRVRLNAARDDVLGGPITMRTAAAVPNRVGAAASFHGGGLVTQMPASPHLLVPQMKAQYLFAVAQNDDMREPEAKNVLKDAFAKAKLDAEIEVYPAMHGWCPPDSQVHDMAQAEKAWSRMLVLFERALA